MCDISGMMTLSEYTAQFPERTQAQWAQQFGVSRSFFAELVGNRKMPGRETMAAIERETNGAVPIEVWFRDVRASNNNGNSAAHP